MVNLRSNIQLKKTKKICRAPGLAWCPGPGMVTHVWVVWGGGDHARPRLITWGLAGPKWGGPAWYTHVGGGLTMPVP